MSTELFHPDKVDESISHLRRTGICAVIIVVIIIIIFF